MNRPIEFRLLNENKKIVGYEKWHYGNFNMEHKKDYYVSQPLWLYSTDREYWSPGNIEHRYKNQFTGLLDKNGNKIFESDLLKHPKQDELGLVYWDKISCSFKVKYDNDDNYALFLQINDKGLAIVVGNVFEHPNLI